MVVDSSLDYINIIIKIRSMSVGPSAFSQEIYTLITGARHSLLNHVVEEAKITNWQQNSS